MSKSIWYIFTFGIVAMFILMMCMCMSLEGLRGSPVGNRVRLAEGLRNKFRFDSVGADVQPENDKTILRISYLTGADSKFDMNAQNREMQAVADFAAANYDGRDKKWIDEIRIKRTEIHGRGCWQESYVSNHSVANPSREKERDIFRRPP